MFRIFYNDYGDAAVNVALRIHESDASAFDFLELQG